MMMTMSVQAVKGRLVVYSILDSYLDKGEKKKSQILFPQ